MAFSSNDAQGPSFEGPPSVTAVQCIAAYEVAAAAAGARVRLVQHVNAKVGLAEHLRPSVGEEGHRDADRLGQRGE